MTYSVKEIFLTLQGEGGQAGRAAVFLRFSGCNLWSGREQDRATAVCTFCDTDFVGTDGEGGGRLRDAEALARAVARCWTGSADSKLVVCTGGEPLLQLDRPLIDALHGEGFDIAIETNGTLRAPAGIDWICVSPKADAPLAQTKGNELKLVYPQPDVDPAKFIDLDFQHFFLQPMDGPEREAATAAAVRYCLEQGFQVYLLEWEPASSLTGNNGINEHAQAVFECVAKISEESRGARPFLIGHSLGGTLAAICGAVAPQSVRGLVLLSAPLCFEPGTSKFRDALISLVPSALSDADSFPGSLLSHVTVMASPGAFVWSRLRDAALSVADPRAMEIHARVERWALDEVAVSGKLFHQMIGWLYRENRLCRGILNVRGNCPGSCGA